ncbi:MAG TPA: magnesium/cobalt transporter CorA [Cytophagaceae bacterium]|jgi:magnesium transporter
MENKPHLQQPFSFQDYQDNFPDSTKNLDADISIFHYDEATIEEKKFNEVEECFIYKDKDKTVTWIDVDDTSQIPLIQKLSQNYGLHALLVEDIICADQRPKLDEYNNHLFIVVKMLTYDNEKQNINSEQISFVLGSNYVMSFQELDKKGDVFDKVRERIRNSKGKIRKYGADYLLYALIDTIVDNYFIILEKIGERIEDMEGRLITDPNPSKLRDLYRLKREVIFIRKSVWPLREVINKLERDYSELITDHTKIYIKDVYDHTVQVIDTVESYRDILASMLDIYLSSISNKMNSVMKVLTVISTIFMPLTFIVGVYGMNFQNMPELKWKYGYFIVLGVCGVISFLMLSFFRKKRWL